MTEELRNIQLLLDSVASINKRYAEVQKAYEESGVRYNIFNVLGLASSEVRLHSSILASLLKPGKHGAKNAFLEAFLALPSLGLPEGFMDPKRIQVEQEKYIGRKTKTTGGRIDLFLTDGHNTIVIENKIYAGDQENQLLRYHKKFPKAKLVYLTLDGKDPDPGSIGSLTEDDYTCLSYRDDIVQWLRECVKQAANLPYIRETINQYINTIQQLTNTDMPTNPEIVDLISKAENISAAYTIRDNISEVVTKLMNQFISDLRERIKKEELPFECVTDKDASWMRKGAYIAFVHPQWKDVEFCAEFDTSDMRNLYIGFCRKRASEVDDINKLTGFVDLAKSLGYDKHTTSWLWDWVNGPEPNGLNWNNAKTMISLTDGSMVNWFIDVLKKVIEQAEDFDL